MSEKLRTDRNHKNNDFRVLSVWCLESTVEGRVLQNRDNGKMEKMKRRV